MKLSAKQFLKGLVILDDALDEQDVDCVSDSAPSRNTGLDLTNLTVGKKPERGQVSTFDHGMEVQTCL